MTEPLITVSAADLAEVVTDAIDRAMAPLMARIDELSARPIMKYAGTFETGRRYVAGNFVTHDGSLWHCNLTTENRPGDGGDAWTLCVKKGRDAK